jgi:hypothetical protein
VTVALGLAIVGITAGALSGAYHLPPSADVTSEPAHALPCAAFTDGAPAGAYIGGACYLPTTDAAGFPNLDTAHHGTDIPRCASDDGNTSGLPRCYVESPGTIIIVDADDSTIATLK